MSRMRNRKQVAGSGKREAELISGLMFAVIFERNSPKNLQFYGIMIEENPV